MKLSIISKLESLQDRYIELEMILSDSTIISDQERFRTLSREYSQLINISQYFHKWKKNQEEIKNSQDMMLDPEMHEIAQEELQTLHKINNYLEQQLYILLLPQDENDQRNCYLEVRAGTGGNEAAIFAGDLFRMYSRYADSQCWTVEIISAHEGEIGGYKEIITKVIGKGAYGRLKFESGGHRVQRVPDTESQGRIHTSSCTIAVMPELPEIERSVINNNQLKIDTFRSSGAGGQHVNTTDSAIRITHLPTGIVVECQDERSQHKNKAKALSVLASRIYNAEKTRCQQTTASTRRSLLGSGARSDRNRTYNFPQGRITDHRIQLTIYCLDDVMAGKLNTLIEPIMQEHQADQLTALASEKD
ncbi:Peptide chain release factor RF1 [Candidatus Erwinia haradaeae]|uniref:Peptide chain release factor 1 n=1 Tax=Candidatus Erwinia haradaeae TaxID=1922217 RepID=A0A451DK44_9GAMM|nr:peptide chain release factor 1 [Candidatus Erwinia haradaeae]VFP87058.1 Peptide chain release factor RF1 [Candidatus Erwinia haradaeae]